jgi:mannose/fructose/N-acetylgalactosamine-specific phosphotransferase system component IIB
LSVGPALVRIDDRLLHGQVAMGWAAALGSKLIVIANDEVAADDWLARLYADAAPPEASVEILAIKEAAERYAEFTNEALAAILLVKNPADAVELVDLGAETEFVNVGGIHFEEGKRQLLPYLFVDEEDEVALRRLLELGVKVEAQDVPGGRRYELAALLGGTG